MRLTTRLRLNVAVSALAAAAVGLVLAWSVRESRRARDAADAAALVWQRTLERVTLRDEYLLYREERPREQWERKTAELASLLQGSSSLFERAEDRWTLAEMQSLVERTRFLFRQIALLPDERQLDGGGRAAAAAQRERATSTLLLLSYDISGHANDLSRSAASQAETAQRRAMALVMLAIAAALAITVGNAFVTSRLLERRMTRLRDGAETIAAGNLSHRIGDLGDDELGDLARAFDSMSGRLEEARTGLERRAAEVAARLTGELQRNVAQLEVANKELEAFSYSVSHDLRAPLRHVAGFVDLLARHAPESLDEKGRHYLQVITEAARKMGTLIDDLLAFSRMGRAEMSLGPVALGPLVESVIEEAKGHEAGRQVVWEVGPLPEVVGDAAMLRLVWSNLVDNALKFSRPRTPARIALGAVGDPREVRCFVRDNGVGFDAKYAGKLFGVFQRLHRDDEFEGTGVGLANVQRIVHRHGGRVWAEGAVDEGATFWFSLPVKEGAT